MKKTEKPVSGQEEMETQEITSAPEEETAGEERTGKKKKKRLKTALLILAAYAVLVAAVAAAVDGRHVRFYMSGPERLTVECGQPYEDPGCYAVSAGRLFGEGSKQLPLRTEGTVDSSKVGETEVRYVTRFLLWKSEAVRTVQVVDTTPPEIRLLNKDGYEPNWLEGYEEEGYVAEDLCDGDLTEQVQREVQDGRIVYTVADAAGNSARVERELDFSATRPKISLNGGNKLELLAGRSFSDPGFTAVDSLGNDLSANVQTEGQVIPYEPGTYQLSYSITNAQGDTVSAVRTVQILSAANLESVMPDQKTIYLTFDDGPGPYTGQLLDVLARYDVKATFFVTCNYPDYFDMVGRAFREGHSIGVHSASHNYYTIYASEDAFFEDFDAVQEMIYEQTGSYTNLLRFPGGSSNTVSSFNPGIMSRLAAAVNDMGYQYFDWNVTSGDAGETTETSQVYKNIVDGCAGRQASVVLQHDIKDYSVAAVEKVINWGLRNGYAFSALSLTSPSAHHGIAN